MKAKQIIALIGTYLTTLLTGCESTMNKYDWLASEAAPQGYPMKILHGTFLYPGESHGLYIPNLKLINSGWGKPISTHVVGPDKKPLPDRIEITFYSFAEDQFYHGEFELPYELIQKRFSEGYESNIKNQGTLYFQQITAGVTPGGYVAVWLMGVGKTEEIFFAQAEPIDYDWDKFWRLNFGNGDVVPRKEYRFNSLKASEAHRAIEQAENGTIPFDKWARLRKHYPWEPRFYRLPEPHKRVGIDYLNGELYFLEPPYNTEKATAIQPMPKHLAFHSKGHLFLIHFDEDEMLEVFESMAEGDKRLYLDVAPDIPRSETQIRLRDEDDNITMLEKFTVEEIN